MESNKDEDPLPDYNDFEIILSKDIAPERIIKVLKDRPSKEIVVPPNMSFVKEWLKF